MERLEDWSRTIGIDQTGVFLGMKTAAAALAASGHGSVINISSIFGTSGGFGTSPAYLASDDASFVTGLELYIDGGYTAR